MRHQRDNTWVMTTSITFKVDWLTMMTMMTTSMVVVQQLGLTTTMATVTSAKHLIWHSVHILTVCYSAFLAKRNCCSTTAKQ